MGDAGWTTTCHGVMRPQASDADVSSLSQRWMVTVVLLSCWTEWRWQQPATWTSAASLWTRRPAHWSWRAVSSPPLHNVPDESSHEDTNTTVHILTGHNDEKIRQRFKNCVITPSSETLAGSDRQLPSFNCGSLLPFAPALLVLLKGPTSCWEDREHCVLQTLSEEQPVHAGASMWGVSTLDADISQKLNS